MERVLVTRTRDGKLFEDEGQAAAHEAELEFNAWYEDGNELYGIYAGSRVEVGALKEWLRDNRTRVLQLLGAAA